MSRVDAIRDELYRALAALRPQAPIADWLRKLQEAAGELQSKTNMMPREIDGTPSEPADVSRLVNELREAFALVAEHVSDVYRLPAAKNLAAAIRTDVATA